MLVEIGDQAFGVASVSPRRQLLEQAPEVQLAFAQGRRIDQLILADLLS
jgi:hypothetical protein